MTVFGMSVPLWAAGIGLGAASSVVNDALHTWALPYLPLPEKLKDVNGIALSLGSGAATTVGLAYLANNGVFQSVPMLQLAATGAAAEVAGEWIYQKSASLLGVSQKDLILY